MKWIEKISYVSPYSVTCVWNDGVNRVVNLEEFIINKAVNPENSYAQLLDKNRFLEVKCDGSTLYWENGLEFEDYDSVIRKGPLDIAPEVLYELTEEGKSLIQVQFTVS